MDEWKNSKGDSMAEVVRKQDEIANGFTRIT